MPSTLQSFRKHQKVLMVMTTGLAMISFVILSAAPNPGDMPPALAVLAMAAIFGGAAWVIGQVNGKSNEYLTIGAVGGAVLGLWLSWGRQDPAAIYIDSNSLSGREVFEMKRDRNLANQFVSMAFERSNGFNAAFAEQLGLRGVLFRYDSPGGDSDMDIAITELLKQEADRMGVAISTPGVFDYIKSLAFTPSKALSADQFKEILSRIGIGEERLLEILAQELKARKAYDLLYSQRPTPTPEALYDYYKKLNLQQEAEIAVLPVSDFVDEKVEPTKQELEELFAQYRMNPPGYTAEGRFEEGRPGFRQPPRMKLAYLEAVFDTFEKKIEPVTDADIEARYEQLKKRPFGDALDTPDFGDLPAIPPVSGATSPKPGDMAAPATPPTGEAKSETPPAEAPKTEPATPPANPDAPKTDAAPAPMADPAKPAAETPAAETPAPEKSAAPAPEAGSTPAPETPANPSSAMPNVSSLKFVSFQDEQPPPPPTATTEAQPVAPAAATPAAEGSAPPASSVPALPPAPPGTDPADMPADPPLPTVRPLDDAYRAEIKEEIVRERTQALMEKAIQQAEKFVAEEIGAMVNTPPGEKGHLTREDASKKLKEYAARNDLVYVETTWLSFDEMRTSEDYPVGSAAALAHPQKANVAQDAFESFGRGMFFLPRTAASFDQVAGSQFVYWLTEERPDGEPENMDDPIVKDLVVKTWREIKARKQAEERAKALVEIAKKADKPLTEALAEESVTGEKGTGYVNVRPTGQFSWFRMPVVPSRSMQREASPTITELPGLKPLGDSFMSTVFETMKPGDIGVTHSADNSEYYVVRIVSRNPSTPEELEAFRKTFLDRGLENEYFDLAGRDWAKYGKNPLNELLKRHNVQIVPPANAPAAG